MSGMSHNAGIEDLDTFIIRRAEEVLKHHPLCDSCLGRMFAGYGIGLTNAERGRSLKTIISMGIHARILSGDSTALNDLKLLARNGGKPFLELAKKYVGEVTPVPCSICRDKLQNLIGKLTVQAINELNSLESKSFLVGVRKGSKYEEVEREIALTHGLTSWESVRREVKREVGKRIQSFTGLKPNFRNPDVILMADLDKEKITVESLPIYVMGSYLKLGRYITQMKWMGKKGRNYAFSVEESVRKTAKLVEGTEVVFHASGREDADARMLGRGRPVVVEIKKPRKRSVSAEVLGKAGTSPPWVILNLTQYVSPDTIEKVKSVPHQKIYRALTYIKEGISSNEVETITNLFKNKEVIQRTPTRVLRRRKDIARIRMVHAVSGKIITPHLAEFLIHCDGGLYVKELVNGDRGRTSPSFSEALGKEIIVVFLDVLKHEGVEGGFNHH